LNNGGITTWADAFTKNLFAESTFRNNMDTVSVIKSVMLSTSLGSLVSTLKALADRKETCSKLYSVKIPTLIICGDSDVVTPPEKSIQMNQNIRSSVLRIVPKAGHLSNVEQYEIFNNFICDFLEDN
jgi:pimeloyl-ACP methyl ester carboxylesterase